MKRIIGIFALATMVACVVAIMFYPSDMRGVVPSILKVLSMSLPVTMMAEMYYRFHKRINAAAAFALAVAVVVAAKLAVKLIWPLF